MNNFQGIQKGERQFRPVTGNYDGMERHGDQLFHKAGGRGEAKLGVSGQVEHTNGDGSTKDLARRIAQVYRRVVAPLAGQALLPGQRRSIRDQIIAAMVGEGDSNTQEAIRLIANLMAGLPVDDKTILLGLSLDPEKLATGGTLVKSWPGDGLSVFVPFLRKDESRREVHGVIADETPDKSGEVFDYQSSKPHFEQWRNEAIERTVGAGQPISYGNVRGQHSNVAVGKLIDVRFDDDRKCIPVVAKIVDDDAWNKVQQGVYTGFSIGGKYVRKWGDGPHTRYTAKPHEVSVVDSPCNPASAFTAIKSADRYSDLRQAMRETHEKTLALIAQIGELVAKLTGAAPATTTRFRANPVTDTTLLRQALDNPVTKSPLHDTERSRFVPRGSYDPELVAADPRTAVTKGADPDGDLRKALDNGTPVDPRASRV